MPFLCRVLHFNFKVIVSSLSDTMQTKQTYADAPHPLRIQRLHDITNVKMQTNDSSANAVVRINTA